MSADVLRRAARQIRVDCPIPEPSHGLAFIDYPTGWALQRADGVVHDEQCSAAQTDGAMLCDCLAVYAAWRHWRPLLAVADLLDAVALVADQYPPIEIRPNSVANHALAVARAYLGEEADRD